MKFFETPCNSSTSISICCCCCCFLECVIYLVDMFFRLEIVCFWKKKKKTRQKQRKKTPKQLNQKYDKTLKDEDIS